MPAPLPVERLDPPPDPETFAARYLTARPAEGTLPPVILAGASPVRWAPDDLVALEGDAIVGISVQPRGNVFGANARGDAAFQVEYMPLAQAIVRVRSAAPDARYYVRRQRLEERLPRLRAVLPDPAHACGPSGAVFIWISQGHVISPLHMDLANNWFCQLHGRKRMRLYAPSEFDRMYPHGVAEVSHHSLVDADAPDLARFPRFAEATCYEAILEPGDMLHLPAYWWHHVTSLEESISLSFMRDAEGWQQLAFHLARANAPISVVDVPLAPGAPRWDQRATAPNPDDGK